MSSINNLKQQFYESDHVYGFLPTLPTLISLINVALSLLFLGKYSRPYAVIKDPTFIYF